ncbi:unnamed protein product [Sphenostylis stenocarpa]|uniref:Uncharacterized protein n=1 Tax=Sphenostylis stenocarpa TaxID=92480 RepID=A0AA86T0V2_9FABA|nr:unnamed protein product [Sphenostylis stenocarpa]
MPFIEMMPLKYMNDIREMVSEYAQQLNLSAMIFKGFGISTSAKVTTWLEFHSVIFGVEGSYYESSFTNSKA